MRSSKQLGLYEFERISNEVHVCGYCADAWCSEQQTVPIKRLRMHMDMVLAKLDRASHLVKLLETMLLQWPLLAKASFTSLSQLDLGFLNPDAGIKLSVLIPMSDLQNLATAKPKISVKVHFSRDSSSQELGAQLTQLLSGVQPGAMYLHHACHVVSQVLQAQREVGRDDCAMTPVHVFLNPMYDSAVV